MEEITRNNKMKFKFLNSTIAALILSASCLVNVANAGLIFGDNGVNTTISITEDISFVATRSSDIITRFVFEDAYFVAPGLSAGVTGVISSNIGVKVNGVVFSSLKTNSLWGPFSRILGEIDQNDFTISFYNLFNLNIGDIVTLTSGTAVTSLPMALKPTQTPTGVVMVNNGGTALSQPVALRSNAIPEPSTFAIFALGLMSLVSRRFKKQ